MKIAITGASGKTGYRIAEEAIKKGLKVKQIVRKNSKVIKDFKNTETLRISLDNRKLIQNHDFRKKGKKRMDAILKFHSLKDDKIIKDLMECIEHSRYKDTLLNKFNKMIYIQLYIS